jgi:hypothetical protein
MLRHTDSNPDTYAYTYAYADTYTYTNSDANIGNLLRRLEFQHPI